MTDLTQMIRWNANFVRGLAESVLNRAKVIRTSLTPASDSAKPVRKSASAVKRSAPVKRVAAAKTKRSPKTTRRTKRSDA